MTYPELEQAITTWALAQPDMQAGLVVGSRARTAPPPDAWSDLDMILYTPNPTRFVTDSRWLNTFGPIWLAVLETAGSHPEWQVVYAGGLKVDFLLSIVERESSRLTDLLADSPHRVVFERGIRVLFDRSQPPLPPGPLAWPHSSPPLPTAEELTRAVQRGLLSALREARFLRRSDLWRSRMQGEYELKEHLLQLIEWQAQADGADVWYTGRHLDQWANPATLIRLPDCFAAWKAADQRRAFWATVEFFCHLAQELAARLGHPYPTETEARLLGLLAEILPR